MGESNKEFFDTTFWSFLIFDVFSMASRRRLRRQEPPRSDPPSLHQAPKLQSSYDGQDAPQAGQAVIRVYSLSGNHHCHFIQVSSPGSLPANPGRTIQDKALVVNLVPSTSVSRDVGNEAQVSEMCAFGPRLLCSSSLLMADMQHCQEMLDTFRCYLCLPRLAR